MARHRDRTGDPRLAKQTGKNTKGFVWFRLHGKPAKFSLSNCTEVVPNRPGFETEEEGLPEGKEWDINGQEALRPREKQPPSLDVRNPACESDFHLSESMLLISLSVSCAFSLTVKKIKFD